MRNLKSFADAVVWRTPINPSLRLAVIQRGNQLYELALSNPMAFYEFVNQVPRVRFNFSNIDTIRTSYGPLTTFVPETVLRDGSVWVTCSPKNYVGDVCDAEDLGTLLFDEGTWKRPSNGMWRRCPMSRDGNGFLIERDPRMWFPVKVAVMVSRAGGPASRAESVASLPHLIPYDHRNIRHVRATYGPAARFVRPVDLNVMRRSGKMFVAARNMVRYYKHVISDEDVDTMMMSFREGRWRTQDTHDVGLWHDLELRARGGFVEAELNGSWRRLIIMLNNVI